MVQKVLWVCEAKNATETDEHCQPERMGTKEFVQKLKTIQTLEDCGVPVQGGTKWRIEGQKKRITRKEYQRLVNNFEMERFMAPKKLVELCERKNCEGKRRVAKGRR